MERKELINDGVRISYLKCGQGRPLIFLHGNGEDSMLFSDIIERFSKEDYAVYALDTRGHGKSDKVKRLDYNDMAEDVMELIRQECPDGNNRPVLFGFSDGGITGLLLAIKYPEALSELIVAGVNLSPDGLLFKTRLAMRVAFFFTRSDKLRLMLTQPDIKAEQLKGISVPVTVFHAQDDNIVKLSHSAAAAQNVQNGKLIFLDNENHGSYIENNDKLYKLIKAHWLNL